MAEKKKRLSKKLSNKDIDAQACALVRAEKARWEVATAFITDRVSFKMRNLIRTCRKNYYGVFDQPYDQNTMLEKIWYPLTEINVEAVVKNIDLDQKDINFRAKHPNGYGVTDIVRGFVKDKLGRMHFGQDLKDSTRMKAIDGTVVWKTYKEYGKMQRRTVDLLNIYIDPTALSIQAAYRFTERSLLLPEEMIAMNGWRNLDGIGEDIPEGLPQTDPYWMNRATGVNSNVKMWDCYETWGKIPKSLITGLREDENEEVEGHIVASGIDSPGRERCHLIELNTKTNRKGEYMKPYEEDWYTRVPNRWYGRGIAEKLLTLQIYANIVFNVRINRSRVSQLGLFKIKKGSGVTPQMLSRLQSNGAVVLNNLDDLEQLEIAEVGMTSYKDEEVINTMSERLTNAFEVVTGEALPSSTPATNAAIQNQNAKSGFSMIKETTGIFIQRWMDNHALPILAEELTAGEIVRIAGDEDSFNGIVDRVLMFNAKDALEAHWKQGYFPDPQEFQMEMDSARERMMRGDMFVRLVKDIIIDEIDTEVYVTNEDLDVTTTVSNLMTMMQAAPQYSDAIVKQTFDLLGLGQPKANQQPMLPQGAPQGAPGGDQQLQGNQPGPAQGNPPIPGRFAAMAGGNNTMGGKVGGI